MASAEAKLAEIAAALGDAAAHAINGPLAALIAALLVACSVALVQVGRHAGRHVGDGIGLVLKEWILRKGGAARRERRDNADDP